MSDGMETLTETRVEKRTETRTETRTATVMETVPPESASGPGLTGPCHRAGADFLDSAPATVVSLTAEATALEIRVDTLRRELADLDERTRAVLHALRRLDRGRARGGRRAPG